MSLGQDFLAGYQTTSGARERKRDRDDKLSQEQLRKQFELDRDAERYRQEKLARDAGFDNQTNQRIGAEDFTREQTAGTQQFTTTRDSTLNSYDTGKLEKTQANQNTQAQLDRDARLAADIAKRKQDKKQFRETKALDYAKLGLGATQQNRAQDWRENPANPENRWRDSRADQVEEMTRPIGAPGAPAAPTTPKAPPASAPKPISTKAEFDALPAGTRFVWNGKNGVKN